MLISTKEIIRYADEKKIAIGAFNISGFDCLRAVIQAAEKAQSPVIIEFAQGHQEEGVISLSSIGPLMIMAAKESSVPIAVHLDHSVNLSFIKEALDYGFTSIMYDGSALSYEDNVANTRLAVELATQYNASIEAELGVMAGITLNNEKIIENRHLSNDQYTDPILAKDFVNKTKIDYLACSFGTVHGQYLTKPKLDFKRLKQIYDSVHIPIVMHGGSGISSKDYHEAIKYGVRKINYYTYMALAGAKAIQTNRFNYYHEYVLSATKAMEENVFNAIQIFGGEK